jgi:hypothetical protein
MMPGLIVLIRAPRLAQRTPRPCNGRRESRGVLHGLTSPHTRRSHRPPAWRLGTTNADGTPHVAAVGTLPIDGVLSVISGLGTRKSRNLARDARCVLTVSTHRFDLVVEASARIVTDRARLERIAQVYADQGWPAQVNDDGTALTAPYSAPSAGPPPWHAYDVTPTKVIAVGGESGGATAFDL